MRATSPILSARDALLAVLVMAIWGSNFVVIPVGLAHFPPLLFAALRFLIAFLPAALLLRRPDVPWKNLAAYGLLVGAGQFGLLYIAMDGHITPGLASLVVQTQVFFTIGFAAVLSGERPKLFQCVALLLAVGGLSIILSHTDGTTTALGLGLVLGAAANWAASNLVVRSSPGANMLGYVVWSSLFAVMPLLGLSMVFEGWPAIRNGLASAGFASWAALAWQAVGNTLIGYGLWAWLMSRYPVATIAPMALLVPIFGMGASALVLGESLDDWKITAGALVMSGLAVNLLWPRVSERRGRPGSIA